MCRDLFVQVAVGVMDRVATGASKPRRRPPAKQEGERQRRRCSSDGAQIHGTYRQAVCVSPPRVHRHPNQQHGGGGNRSSSRLLAVHSSVVDGGEALGRVPCRNRVRLVPHSGRIRRPCGEGAGVLPLDA